jgi:hypothetical protein
MRQMRMKNIKRPRPKDLIQPTGKGRIQVSINGNRLSLYPQRFSLFQQIRDRARRILQDEQ